MRMSQWILRDIMEDALLHCCKTDDFSREACYFAEAVEGNSANLDLISQNALPGQRCKEKFLFTTNISGPHCNKSQVVFWL